MPAPPEEFVAIQVSRLNEALLVAYSAMGEMNLKAVDRVVKIVRELERYHGFCGAERRLSEPSRLAKPEDEQEETAEFGAAPVRRPEFPPQDAEKIDSGLGLSTPQAVHAVDGALRRPSRRAAPQDAFTEGSHDHAERDARPEFPAQAPENMDFAPGPEMESEAPRGARATHTAAHAWTRATPWQAEPLNDCSENLPEESEIVENAPGNDGPATTSPLGEASDLGPALANANAFRPIKLRMTLNGVMAG